MYGTAIRSYVLLLLGRMIFGMGGESVKLCNSAIEATWFAGSEIAFVMSIDYGFANLGTFTNDLLAPTIYSRTGSLQFVFTIGLGICVFSWMASTLLFCLDRAREREEGPPVAAQLAEPTIPISNLSKIKQFPCEYWLIMAAYVCALLSIAYFNNISSEFFQNRFHFSLQSAGTLIGLEALVSGMVSPWLGRLLDRTPHKLRFCII